MFDMENIPGWCACVKITGVNSMRIHFFERDFEKLMKRATSYHDASAICVSVNEEEIEVIALLKKLRFSKGPSVKNWLHGKRKTCLYFKQIPYSILSKYEW